MRTIANIKSRLTKTAVAAKVNYRLIVLFTLVLLSIFIIYGNDLQALANEALHNEAYNYIILMPFFAGFLFYLKKDAVKAALTINKHGKKTSTRYVTEVMGVALCIVAFLIYWYGSYTFYPLEYHVVTLPIFIMGITLILMNFRSLRALIFPILFLLFLIPLPTTLTSTAGGILANFNTQASYTITKTFLPVTLSTNYGAPTLMLTTAAGQPVNFSVDIPCSGIYSLVAFAMFATFLAFISSTTLIRRILLFASGFAVFTILNIIRITTVVSIGYWFGEETALIVHSFAGFILIFSGMLLLLGLSDKILKIKIATKPAQQTPCPECSSTLNNLKNFCQNCGRFIGKSRTTISKNLFAKALLIILACSVVVITINAPTFATAQGNIELSSNPESANATKTFPEIPGYNLVFLYRDTAYEKIAGQDISLVYAYFPPNSSSSVIYVSVGVSPSLQNLHNWEVCLIGMQTAQGQYPLVEVLDSRDTQLLQDTPLIARYLVFQSPDNYTQVTLYWYEKATFKTGLAVGQKYVRISLIILTKDKENYPANEQELLAAGKIIAAAWEPMKNQSLISLGIPAQQSLLVASIAFIFITGMTQYLAERRSATNNMKIFNNFASYKERIVLETANKLAKENKFIKTSDIVEGVRKRTGKQVNFKRVLSILNTLEEHGMVRKTIVNVGNMPRQTWKA